MTKDEFKNLMKQAGFKNKQQLAQVLHLTHSAVNAWGSTNPYPKWLKVFLQTYIELQRYKKS